MSKVSVEEGETSVRVEASKPHLVSLGGGRLSTSITIHPLDKGKTVLGSGRNVDIPVAGVGVEEVHCAIENDRGTLILTPFASLTSLDGRRVTQPTQLTQGSILGVGKTAIFRFNHPDQARMIKKSLPDKSSVPITFYPGMDGNTPHHHLESRSRDALHDLSQILAKNNFLSSPKNGDFKLNGDSSPKISLPSPSFNRDPVPYFAQKPPVKSPNAESPVHNDSKSEDYKQITIDEILNVCSEYERQMQFERSTKPVQNRIMTNGSLPREKRSPQKSPTISDPEHAPMNENKEKDVRKMHTYENISFTTGSPRPRIKTFLNKENLKENVENRIPLILDLENINEPSFHRNTDSPIYSNVNSSPKEGEKRTEALKVMKYNFLGCSPQNSLYVNGDDRMSVSPVSPSWTNPTLDVDSFPDYEILTGPEENIVRPEGGLPPDKIKELLDEKELIQKKLISLKELVKEFERQEQEMIQESAIEEALVCGELSAQDEKLVQDEKKISILKQRIVECEKSMETCLAKQEENQERFNYVKTEHLSIIETLEHKISNCQDKTLKMELKSSLVEQNDLLDRDKKSHELSEFQLLEEEAGWLSKREDLQKELNEAIERHEARKVKVATLKKSQPTLNNKFELKRIVHMKEIEEGRNRLNEINRELERLSPKKIENGTEGVIRRRAPSQDDLDRISRITSGAPIDMGDCNSLGKRTIESLQEIERNRAIHLANQGSLVIQEERQRVEELKKRVQDEVKAQWQLNRNSNCQSFTSVTSDSSLEPTRDSGVSSEEAEKAMQSDEQKMSPVNLTPESRPLSDASVYSDDPSIKLRSKSSSNLQRPLTRYLPIQSEIDLRKHIESAGHQVDLCPHVVIDSTSCRGYLNKMSTKFNSRWNKRWFVFDRGARTFSYYADKAEKKVRGGAYFKAIEEVYVDHLNTFKSPNSKVTFVVKSSNRLYNLEAPSPEALRIWVDVIFTGAEGHLHNYT